MAIKVKVGGAYQDAAAIKVKQGGVYTAVAGVFVKSGGVYGRVDTAAVRRISIGAIQRPA